MMTTNDECRRSFEEWSRSQGWAVDGSPDARQRRVTWRACDSRYRALLGEIRKQLELADKLLTKANMGTSHDAVPQVPIRMVLTKLQAKEGV